MSGLIGVIAQETSRYTMFGASLTSLQKQPDDEIKWWFGHGIADNCNALVRYMYERGHEWLWLLGDDHTFSPSVLDRLLAVGEATGADIVVPLCLMRAPPYMPVVYSGFSDESTYRRAWVDLDEHPGGGMIPIHSAGSAGMLIQRRVFDELADPWFEAAVLDGTQLGEDLYFCDKARDAGASLVCDLDTRIGHCLTAVAWPVPGPDGWKVGFSMMGGFEVVLPPGATRT